MQLPAITPVGIKDRQVTALSLPEPQTLSNGFMSGMSYCKPSKWLFQCQAGQEVLLLRMY